MSSKPLFGKYSNTFARLTLFFGAASAVGILFLLDVIQRSPYVTEVDIVKDQPVPFSHQHHVGGLGIDCRYCHTSVEQSSFAGIPPTATCMNCHSQIWADSPMLEPVRDSYRSGKPIEWVRLHDLPDFVYFNHSIHVTKGIGCTTCHGQVDEMPLMWKTKSLYMGWCLDCHKHPDPYFREPGQVFRTDWRPSGYETRQAQLRREYHVQDNLIHCSACHR